MELFLFGVQDEARMDTGFRRYDERVIAKPRLYQALDLRRLEAFNDVS